MTNWVVTGTTGFARETCVSMLLGASSTTLLGCCGSMVARSIDSRARHALPRTYSSVEEVGTDPGVEAVWIASPTGSQAEQAIILMCAGKSVLIEKPLALTLLEAERVKQVADRTGSKAVVGFHQRLKVAHRRARDLVTAGVPDEISYMRCHFLASYEQEPGGWRHQASTAGGGWAVNDIGTHLLDTVVFVGRSGVTDAKAFFGHVRFAYETNDILVGVLKLQSGALASIEAATATASPTTRLELVGNCGSRVVDGSFQANSTLVLNGRLLETYQETQAYSDQVHAFALLLSGEANHLATLQDGIDNVRRVETMLRS